MRKLPLAALCLAAFAACSKPQIKPAPLAENQFEEGGIVVEEHRSPLAIDSTVVLVADEAKRAEYQALLDTASGRRSKDWTSLSVSVDAPYAKTIESYISGIREADARARERHAAENPGKPYPFEPHDYAAMRAELETRLRGYKALVLRYIHTKEDAPAALAAAPAASESQQLYLEGTIHFMKGDYDRARKTWTRSVELDPKNDDARAGLEKLRKVYGK